MNCILIDVQYNVMFHGTYIKFLKSIMPASL